MTRARDNAFNPLNTSYSSKNRIMNGNFAIWQRGTTFSGGNSYTADRWSADSATTITRQTGTEQFPYCLRVTGSGGNPAIRQGVELPITGNAGIFQLGTRWTVSYYARTSTSIASTQAIYVAFSDGAVAGSANAVEVISNTNIGASSTSWTRYSLTFTINSSPVGTNTCLQVVPYIAAGAYAGNWEITGVQLEQNSVATSFTTNTPNIQSEIAACQRYFYRLGGLSANNPVGTGFINATAQTAVCITYPVTMRSAPGFSATGGNNYNVLNGQTNYTSSSITSNSLNINNSWIYVSTLGMPSMPVGSASYVFAPSATSYLDFSAEL
jgi:hypothetical protein